MKIVVFGDQRRIGALDGDRVVDLNRANAQIPATLEAFIAAGPRALEQAERAIREAHGGDVVFALQQVKLRAPFPGRRIACMGGNFADHLMGMEANRSGEAVTLESITEKTRAAGQWGFWKVLTETPGPDDSIVYPRRTEYFDYEAEAAIIIANKARTSAPAIWISTSGE